MSESTMHRAASRDGTAIARHVQGHGPPLVLVHGAFADGDLEWGALLPRLAEHFTCHVMSTRGRGSSDDHANHSPRRLIEDIRAVVDDVGEPVTLAGVSGGGMHALGAAAGHASVRALAVYEPPVFEVLEAHERARLEQTLAEAADALVRLRPADSARIFLGFVGNDAEREALEGAGELLAEAGRHAVTDLLELQHHVAGAADASPTGAATLAAVTAPVTILRGSASARAWFADGARHVARHVRASQVQVIEGAGHLAVALGDERIADELIRLCGLH